MNPSQENISNNVHEYNIPGFIIPGFINTIQAGYTSNINCNDPSCNCNNGSSVMNDNIFPVNTSISPDQNISNNVHESNIPGFINTSIQAGYTSNINCNDPSCSCNNGSSVMNDNIFPVNTSISPDHNNHQQSMSNNSTSDNDTVISPDHNYQQSISNDALNNNAISPDHNYQHSIPNNASPPQFYPQYIDQNSPNYNVPLFNSLGITINSPQTNIIIMPVTGSDIRNLFQQDHTNSNNSS